MKKPASIIVFEKNSYKELSLKKDIYVCENFNINKKKSPSNIFNIKGDNVKLNLNFGCVYGEKEEIKLKPYKVYKFTNNKDEIDFMYFSSNEKVFFIKQKNIIRIGSSENSDIRFTNVEEELVITIEEGSLYIDENKSNKNIYLNGLLITEDNLKIEEGDCLLVNNIKIELYKEYIKIDGEHENYESKLVKGFEEDNHFDDFPSYKRSPRLIKTIPQEIITFKKAPAKIDRKKSQLAKIIVPPIMMIIITILISIVNPRGLYVIISVAGSLVSTIFSVITYINDTKETKRKNALREKVFKKYLLDTRKKLENLRRQQIEACIYNNPDVKEIENMIIKYSSRIYERSINDDDFLQITLGKANMESSYKMKLQNEEIELEKDELNQMTEDVYREFKTIKDMPLVVDLKKAHLGIVGEKGYIHEQLNLIFSQLTFFHSYHDLEIVFLYEEKYRKDFEWIKWYKHLKVKAINVTGIIDDESVRDQVLGSMSQILKERKIKTEEKKKETTFLPHYLFVIDEPKLVINHPIMEYLQNNFNDLGFSIIYTTHLKSNLPENIKTILEIENSNDGRLVLNEGFLVDLNINLNHVENINLENLSRGLSCLDHIQGISSKIPDKVTFLEMYNVNNVDELNVESKWKNNLAYKTLAVPLGFRAKGDIVNLDLHEKAHGPHGLIAGTTGSGKSEILQSYILSLGVNFHPHEVGFLLIDYKGGGMASLFKNLPHLLGTITNLDGSESTRAMASIKSELSRRQSIFNKYEINHINQYSKLFKNGIAKEPMPHLFLISDEFAELKKEQPDFMSELVSAARIGRSLGIHLILATQKPTGVVDDQIWSNSKFKLALKVQNEADSNEVLKTPDAANITQPGRSYLQVGNNEIYELFQSAWSGANYNEDEAESIDSRIYLINKLGQGQLLNKDLSNAEDDLKIKVTELDVVVDHLENTFKKINAKKVAKPWLPPLEDKLISPYIDERKIDDIDKLEDINIDVALGLVDIPEKQVQQDYVIDFKKDGNLAIFSSVGFGKSTTLTTIALTLGVKNAPKNLQYYVMDFGNSSLVPLKQLPHTLDYIKFDDDVKLKKVMKKIEEEIKNRKLMFMQKSAMNFNMYNAVSKEKIPAIVVFVDNYDVVRELGYEAEEFFVKLSRDGLGLGIYTVITASRANAVKYSVLNNFKNKIVHYLFDATEISTLVGRTDYKIKEIPGRSLVKLDKPYIMQVYTPVECNDELEYTNNINKIIDTMNKKHTGEKLEGIRMLPEILDINTLIKYSQKKNDKNLIPVGLEVEEVTTEFIDLRNSNNLIIGGAQTGKTNLLKILITSLKNSTKTYIFDSKDGELYGYKNFENISYIDSLEMKKEFLEALENLIKERKNKFDDYRLSEVNITPKKFFATLEPICVLIDDCDNFIQSFKEFNSLQIETLMTEAINVGISFIATTAPSKLRGFDNLTKIFKESINGIILGNPNEQNILQVPHMRIQNIETDIGFIYKKGQLKQIKIPKVETCN